MASAKFKPGITLPCPMCGELAATFALDLEDLMVKCECCDDVVKPEVALGMIQEHVRKWQAVVELASHAEAMFGRLKNDEKPAGIVAA
jgi:hypothetical protein